jgi:hypothetical protein
MKLCNPIFWVLLSFAGAAAAEAPTPAADEESIAPNYKKLLGSPNFADVERAARALVENHDPEAPALFGALYAKSDAQRRLLAIRSIGELGLKGQEASLFKVALGDLYQAIRLEAVDVLAKINTPEKAITPFITATKDTKNFSPVERYRALIAVARLGGANAKSCLREWLKSNETDMAVAAADGIAAQRDFELADALLAQMNGKDPEVRPAAKEALERLAKKQFGYDMMKWAEWQKQQRERQKTEDTSPSDSEARKYNPYALPIEDTAIDLVIVFDSTGSMGKVWPFLKKAFTPALEELIKHTPSFRLGTIKYRASDPSKTMSYMISPKALTRDFDAIQKDMKDTMFGGGSGGMDLGLKFAVSAMTWRANARKIIWIVGDCSPDNDINWCLRMAKEGWEMDHIIVDTIFVKTMHGPEHRPTFKDLAEAGVGHFYEYTGAQPHLVDMLAEKPNTETEEPPKETASKLCTPRTKPEAEPKKEIPTDPRPPPPPQKGADD